MVPPICLSSFNNSNVYDQAYAITESLLNYAKMTKCQNFVKSGHTAYRLEFEAPALNSCSAP